jgi:hypothetical protein
VDSFWYMEPEEYLERAEHYRIAKESATDELTRYHLDAMERSYRALAASEKALRKSSTLADAPSRKGNP